MPAAPAPITRRSVSLSQWRSADKRHAVSPQARASLQKPDRYPEYKRHQQRPMRSDVAGDRLQSFIRMHPVEGSGRIVAGADERFEQAHAHREEEGR